MGISSGASQPLVSIITPVLNNASEIEACIRSVANQTYPIKEHLIIDGGSTDGTLKALQRLASMHQHIRVFTGEDAGIYDAMNKGIGLSKGDWLYFLGSDDSIYNPEVLAEVFSNPEVHNLDMMYGNIHLKKENKILGEPTNLHKLKRFCTHHQATFIRKTVFDIFGPYRTEYIICADWEFTIRCFQHPDMRIRYIDKTIASYSTSGTSQSMHQKSSRVRDKQFHMDFFSLFPVFPTHMKFALWCDDHIPKWLNPLAYFRYMKRQLKR